MILHREIPENSSESGHAWARFRAVRLCVPDSGVEGEGGIRGGCQPRRLATTGNWRVMSGNDTSEHIVTDVDSKCRIDLLSHPWTAKPGVASFQLKDGLDRICLCGRLNTIRSLAIMVSKWPMKRVKDEGLGNPPPLILQVPCNGFSRSYDW